MSDESAPATEEIDPRSLQMFSEIVKGMVGSVGQAKKLESHLGGVISVSFPSLLKEGFSEINRILRQNPLPSHLAHLESVEGSRTSWINRTRNATLSYTREGLGASFYHIANIQQIERALVSTAKEIRLGSEMYSGTGLEVRDIRKLDYEYQAYVVAIRRTLEYFAKSVAAYFKAETGGIRSLEASVRDREPKKQRLSVISKLPGELASLDDVIPPVEKKGSRDIVVHHRPLPAAKLSVAKIGDRIVITMEGGGEKIRPWDSEIPVLLRNQIDGDIVVASLSPVLLEQFVRVCRSISVIYKELGFVSSVWEFPRSSPHFIDTQ